MRISLCFLLFFYLSTNLYSQGFQVNFQGQKQQGMGGAGTGLCIDAAAVFFNPGALSYLKKNEVNAAITPIFSNVLFEEDGTNEIGRTNSPVGTPFSFYINYKHKDSSKVAFGLGVYTPFGSTVSYEDGWVGRYALKRLQLKSIFIQPSISYKVTDEIGIGIGLAFVTGGVNLQKNIPVQGTDGKDGLAELSGSANGFGYNVGLYAQPNEKWSFGITYRSQIDMKVTNGEAIFTVPSSLDANFPDGKFSSSLPLPKVVSIGAGYKLKEKWQFALDVNYVGWKAYDTLAFDYEENTTSLVDTKSARNYKNIMAVRAGASYALNDMFTFRLGLAYGLTPVQDGYVTPETPDANRLNYTAGLSAVFGEHFGMDVSIFYTHLKRKDTNLETNLSGTFTTNVFAPGLALYYRFGHGKK